MTIHLADQLALTSANGPAPKQANKVENLDIKERKVTQKLIPLRNSEELITYKKIGLILDLYHVTATEQES